MRRITYNEAYFSHPSFVVLIYKEYMFHAYDDSARVLSHILEYKLYYREEHGERKLTACGPDKEKIMRVLNAHNVNYLILEYGEITEERHFSENRFEHYLSEVKGLPIEEMVSHAITHHAAPAQSKVFAQPQHPTSVPDWIKVGVKVYHNIYGKGEILKIFPAGSVQVKFQGEIKGLKVESIKVV